MYSIITTDGFIIDSRPSGEAGKLLYIFTRDHGLVMATAQGIRLEKSKLRYFIQDYSFGTYSFVKGKEYWRLTNAQESQEERRMKNEECESLELQEERRMKNEECESQKANKTRLGDKKELVAKVALLLKKMLHGEEANPALFDVVESLRAICAEGRPPRVGLYNDSALESLIVLRIFHKLGYIGDMKELNLLLNNNDISGEILATVEINRVFINTQINKAIKESHL